jgi:signal transduction histidine kinase
MAARYETEKKELEIARQQEVIARHALQRGLLVGGIAVSAVILALLWNMLRLRNRRNLALAEMNTAKDKFFSIISHDLKNPVVAQRDALQMLVNNARIWDADTLTDYCNELLKSTEGHVGLILHLLGWARLQTGRMTYTPQQFYLAARLRADISIVRNTAAKKGVTLIDTIPDDALVTADSNMITTVVRNLLTNAVKFTPAGGTVTLDIAGTYGDTPLRTHISVTDTGTGMSREQINSLFSLDNPNLREGTADEQGTGIGLVVCRELLEKHGSTLHIESQQGKGSRFWFEL